MKKIICSLITLMLILSSLTFLTVSAEETERNMLINFELGCVRDGLPQIPADFSGFLGVIVDVGNADVTVTSIGRYWYDANSESHSVKIVDAETKEDIASAEIQDGNDGEFSYAKLDAPVTLKAGKTYYLLSEEDTFGDYYGDTTCGLYCSGPLACNGYVLDNGGIYETKNAPSAGYLALDLKYTYTPSAPEATGDEGVLYGSVTQGAGPVRNNFGSLVGGTFYIEKPIVVTSLGRIYLDGNSQSHVMFLVDADTDKVIPGSTVTVSKAGTDHEINYVDLESPVYLEGQHLYYLVSREYMDGDFWLEGDSLHTSSDPNQFIPFGWTYYISSFTVGSGDYAFVGVNLKYRYAVEKTETTEETTTAADETTVNSETTASGTTDNTESGSTGDETTADTTNEKDNGSNIGLIIGIAAAAVVVIAAIIIVIVNSKKKK